MDNQLKDQIKDQLKIAKIAKNPWIISFVTSLGVGISSLDGGIINVALPTLTKQFNSNLSVIQWIVTGFLLALCITLPLFGKLSDMFSKRYVYLLGFISFIISSSLCGLSFSVWQLIFFRILQGLSGAMLIANNQAIIMSYFPKDKQGRALGINTMAAAVGSFAGPGIGGLLITLGGWRLIFFINIPIGLLGYYLGYKILPMGSKSILRKLDILGSLLFMFSLGSFLLMLTEGFTWGWFSLRMIILFIFSVISSLAFYLWEIKAESPMINFSLFRNEMFLMGNIKGFMLFAAFAANTILLPFYLADALHLSPALSGCILFLPPIMIMLIAPISGFLADRMDCHKLTVVGLIIVMISLILQSFLNSLSSLYFVMTTQIILGGGFALFQSPNNYTTLRSISSAEIGFASSISSLIKNIGRILGITLATTIFTVLETHIISMSSADYRYTLAFNIAFKVALLSAALFVFAAIMIGRKRGMRIEE